MKLTIEIAQDGNLSLCVGDKRIGMVEALSVTSEVGEPTKVSLRFADMSKFLRTPGGQELRTKLLARLVGYKSDASDHPCVEILGPSDTLPSGVSDRYPGK